MNVVFGVRFLFDIIGDIPAWPHKKRPLWKETITHAHTEMDT